MENYELEKKLSNENTSSLNSQLLDAQVIICDLQDDLVRSLVLRLRLLSQFCSFRCLSGFSGVLCPISI